MMKCKKMALILLSLLPSVSSFAQEVKMADTMRSNGRIYVVVAVLVTILLGLIIYIARLDRKISKLEKQSH